MPVQAAAPASRPAGGEDIRRQIAVAVFVAIGTIIVIAQWVLSAWSSPQIGWDFPVFYIAGHLPLHLLYSRDAFAAFWQAHLAPLGVPHWAPYVRPSIFSFLLHPIAALPYYRALWLWLGAGLSAYLAAVGLLLRRLRLPGFLLPVYAGFFPAIVGIISGADASFFLLALALALILLERKRDVLAALALTMCLCKFNLVLLIPILLLLHRRYRALVSFAMGGVLIAAASIALTPVRDYVTAVAEAQSKTAGFFPVGLRGFSAAIGQPWCYPVLAGAVFVLCCWLMKRLPMTEAFCIALTGALLVSPYVTWYDSTLLALPVAVVFARSAMAMRVACVAVLVAVPLWRHGGGNNGPIGFMHVGVELLILAYFVRAALGSRSSLPTGLAETSRKLRGDVAGIDHLESSTRKPRVQMTESGADGGGATAFTIALKDGSQRFATTLASPFF